MTGVSGDDTGVRVVTLMWVCVKNIWLNIL